jgi:hypothetical protein
MLQKTDRKTLTGGCKFTFDCFYILPGLHRIRILFFLACRLFWWTAQEFLLGLPFGNALTRWLRPNASSRAMPYTRRWQPWLINLAPNRILTVP